LGIDIQYLIGKGEGIDIEFKECKSAINKDVYQTVCAFLNRIGGHILLGVRNDGVVVGVEKSAAYKIKKDFATAINNPQKLNPPFYTNIEEYEIDGETVLYVSVPNSSQVHRLNGRIFDRNEDADIDITDNTVMVAALYARKTNVSIETRLLPHITIVDLDARMIDRVRKMAHNQRSDSEHLWDSLSDLDLLKSANLYGKDPETQTECLNLAGVLLLGNEQLIASVLPQYRTDAILRVKDLDRYDDRDDIRVNLVESYDRLMAFVQKHLNDPFYLEGTQRISIRNKVFREVCSNLLMHREFGSAFPAKLIIENGQVRTENANRPRGYGEIDPKSFSPYAKNPIISKFFHEIGLADELGSGFKNLIKYVPQYAGKEPHFIEKDIFTIVVPIPDEKTNQATVPVSEPVSEPDKETQILEFCKAPRTRAEIQQHLGVSSKGYFLKNHLQPLIQSGRLVMTVPDKPNSRNQKYVAGREK
jgi:ATP-dependent DNA helicase RecG